MSGLLGIGGGVFKMPVMTLGMGIPFKVAAATSNFMIGVTAAAGAALLAKLPARRLQVAFAGLLALLGGRMAWVVLGGAR